MSCRMLAVAGLAVPLTLAVNAARADCFWGVGMAELDLVAVERAAPLAADRSLPLGPGAASWISGAEEDFAERALLAFGGTNAASEPDEAGAAVIEGRIVWARDRLSRAREQAALGDLEACAEALDQAREAIAGARAAFR